MTVSIGLSIAALIVALGAAVITYLAKNEAGRSADAAGRSAGAAEASDRRARSPQLAIMLTSPAPPPSDRAIYRVRNDGPQDLDSLVVYRPLPGDSIRYPIAVTSSASGWLDEADLGPIALTQGASFTLCCGSADDLPEFRVRIECRSGTDEWTLNQQLPTPRGPATDIGH